MKPSVCILRTDGTNCDAETAHAFSLAGGEPRFTHINELRRRTSRLADFQILAIPGGFSYGDDIASGKVLAIELLSHLAEDIKHFIESGKLVIGICNGFQVLVRMGLLPYNDIGNMHATLAHNDSGHFQCEWVKMEPNPKSPCVFTQGLTEKFPLQIAHGEGRFLTDAVRIERMQKDNLVALRYVRNPNGSLDSIAGVCDPTGRIFGLMPHPERFVDPTQHPNWRRRPDMQPVGRVIFKNAVRYAAQL